MKKDKELTKEGIKVHYAKTRKDWRSWLEKNHNKEKSVWLIIYKKESDKPSVYYTEAVEEALCFGWIDSKANKRDEESYYQFFARRNPKSNWSGINKQRIKKLIKEGKMTPAGQEMVDLAKSSGTWNALDTVESAIVPDDLKILLIKNKKAFAYWSNFPASSKRMILGWIQNAKRAETRKKRIEETVLLASQNIRANQYRQKGA